MFNQITRLDEAIEYYKNCNKYFYCYQISHFTYFFTYENISFFNSDYDD